MYEGPFEPPSPGSWEIESAHMTRPVSRFMAELFPPNMMKGFAEGTAKYGALLSHLEVAVINGFAYGCPRPVGAPKTAKGPPPKFVFKLLLRLHPELRRRNRSAAETFATKRWQADVKMWDDEWKPTITRQNTELAAVDPSKLDSAGLVAHLDALTARVADAIYRHHALNMCALVPIGDFLAHAKQWTGKDSSTLLGLLTGSSPVSVGATAELDRAVAAIRADRAAASTLESAAEPAQIIETLRSSSGEVGATVRAYCDVVGWRTLSGYDVADLCPNEVPEVLVGAIRAAYKTPHYASNGSSTADETAKLREAVPAEHREQFDELLAEARLVYRIRDERGYLNDAWAIGLARRGLLAAGDRLVEKGKLEARDHAVQLKPTEVRAMLRGEPGPSGAELASHAAYRASKTTADAPASLGFPKSGPPPADWLPPPSARMMRAIGTIMSALFDVGEQASAAKVVRGLPASPGRYEGRACVVLDAQKFDHVEKGDVLIARTTSPSYNVLLPLLGGIVTDRGGMLSHAAIVAREYGLPAVVGTTDGTTLIPDGARVRIDGATGEVQVLS